MSYQVSIAPGFVYSKLKIKGKVSENDMTVIVRK